MIADSFKIVITNIEKNTKKTLNICFDCALDIKANLNENERFIHYGYDLGSCNCGLCSAKLKANYIF